MPPPLTRDEDTRYAIDYDTRKTEILTPGMMTSETKKDGRFYLHSILETFEYIKELQISEDYSKVDLNLSQS